MTSSPTSIRTREALLDAAVRVWSADTSASLGDIATRAGVGRSTLNRHFAGRPELVAAVDARCQRRFAEAAAAARLDEGTGLEALQRLALSLLELGDLLGLVFADHALVDPDRWETEDRGLEAILRRGYTDGSLGADVPAQWTVTVLWTTLFGAWLVLKEGRATRHEIGTLVARTLARGVSAAA